jgi:hypothetical protein
MQMKGGGNERYHLCVGLSTLAPRRTRAVPKTKVDVSGKGEFLNSGPAQLQAQRLGRGTLGGQAPQVDR